MATPVSRARRNASGLARDLEILELLADPSTPDEGYGVVKVAQLLGRDKATVSRAMSTLADAGLISRRPVSLTYQVGPRLYGLAARSAEATLAREARPFLRQLARRSRETAHLSVLRGGMVLTLVSELSPNDVRTTSWEGHATMPLRTPSGRVLVSDWSDAELADWYAEQAILSLRGTDPTDATKANPLPAWLADTETTPVVHDLPSLLADAARIRRRGFAVTSEEFEKDVVAASAPVRDHTDRIVAAVNISAPMGRIGTHLDQLGQYVARAATRLSTQLGSPTRP